MDSSTVPPEPYEKAQAVIMYRPNVEEVRETTIPAPTLFSEKETNALGPSKEGNVCSNTEQSSDPHSKTISNPSWRDLFAFTNKRHAGVLGLSLAATLLVSGLKTGLSVIIGRIFDVVAQYGGREIEGEAAVGQVAMLCLVLVGMGAGTWLSSTLFFSSWITFGELQAKSVRERMFSGLLDKEMKWFDTQEDGVASLLVRISTETRELQMATGQVFGYLANDFVTALSSIILAFCFSWKLTLVLLASVPVSIVVITFATRPLEPALQDQKRELGRASKLASASFTAIDLVKVYDGADHEVEQYREAIQRALGYYLVQARCNAIQMGYVKFWMVALFVLGFWYGVNLVDEGVSAGDVITTFYAALTALEAIEALAPQWLVFAKGMSAGRYLNNLSHDMKKGRKVKKMLGTDQPTACAGDIECTDVSFAYPSNPDRVVLQQSSFFFPSGEFSFIVGQSGSGKSTLSNLILKLYEPLTGSILIDGRPLQTLDIQWIRSNITLIQQSSILFNDTFFQNVAFGAPDPDKVTRDEVNEACEAALLQSTLANLPKGLDTVVGPGGYNLSGGQKQRLALARARLRDTPVLILDEITSGLDPVSRTLVMEAIRQWRQGKTTIIITHDVSQIQDGDYVYVMDDGYLVEEGFRKELMQDRDGIFTSLVVYSGESTPASSSCNSTVGYSSSEDEALPAKPPRAKTVFSKIFAGPGAQLSKMSNRQSLGFGTAQANMIRTQQLWDEPLVDEPLEVFDPMKGKTDEHATELPEELAQKNSLVRGSKQTSFFGGPKPSRASKAPGMARTYSVAMVEDMGDSVRQSRGRISAAQRKKRPSIAGFKRRNEMVDARILEENRESEKTGEASLFTILLTVWPNIKALDRLLLLLGILFCLVTAALNPVFSYVFAQLLQAFWAPENRLAFGKKWALLLLVVAILDAIATFSSRYLLERAGQAWVNAVRFEAMTRILRQPRAWFDKPKHSASRINEVMDRNAEEMRNLVGRFVPTLLIVTCMIFTSIIWALIVSWKLTLVALSSGPVVFATTKGFSYTSHLWETRCNAGAEATNIVLTDTISNIRVVRALTLETYFTSKHSALAKSTFVLGMKRAGYTGILYGLYQSMNYWLTALVFYYGTILLAREHELDAASVVQVINLLIFALGTATVMTGSIPQIESARATAHQLLYYAHMSMDTSHESRGTKKLSTPFPIKMRELAFAYPNRPDNPILRNINLRIDDAETVALVGPSGCGKSTIASLILRLYQPGKPGQEAGMSDPPLTIAHLSPLTFAGTPASEADTASLRGLAAYVPQAPFLFPASAAANIGYGLPAGSPLLSRRNLEAAARRAGIHDLVASLPDGYDTVLGEGGLALSGGQAQRLCIARALARRPRLLVLDEPTSALDAESADMVRATIRELTAGTNSGNSKSNSAKEGIGANTSVPMSPYEEDGYGAWGRGWAGRNKAGGGGDDGGGAGRMENAWTRATAKEPPERMGVVVVTHCREMMRLADRVICLDAGFVAESGGYAELLARRGTFAELLGGGAWLGAGGGAGEKAKRAKKGEKKTRKKKPEKPGDDGGRIPIQLGSPTAGTTELPWSAFRDIDYAFTAASAGGETAVESESRDSFVNQDALARLERPASPVMSPLFSPRVLVGPGRTRESWVRRASQAPQL